MKQLLKKILEKSRIFFQNFFFFGTKIKKGGPTLVKLIFFPRNQETNLLAYKTKQKLPHPPQVTEVGMVAPTILPIMFHVKQR